MNIIVTGGAGFIGSNFVFHMLKKYPDYRIICLDKLTYAGNLSTLAPVMDGMQSKRSSRLSFLRFSPRFLPSGMPLAARSTVW